MPERQRETIQRRLGVRRSRVGPVDNFDQCRSVGGADRALAVLVAAAHHQRCRRPNPTATAVAPPSLVAAARTRLWRPPLRAAGDSVDGIFELLDRRRNPLADRLGYRPTRGSGLRGLGA